MNGADWFISKIMSDAGKAVFLSYAAQDAEAVRTGGRTTRGRR